MTLMQRIVRLAGAGAIVVSLSACSSAGTLGDILGGVLNAPGANQIGGTIQSVDTRNQLVFLRQSDGTTVSMNYDSRTEVVYQNQKYPVTALESGDQVTARVQNNGNNNFYVDLIQVTRSASTSNSDGSSGVYTLEGTVRSIDSTNGRFTLNTQNGGIITVTMPYNPRSTDLTRFRNLRTGDWVRLQGSYVNETRVELVQFN